MADRLREQGQGEPVRLAPPGFGAPLPAGFKTNPQTYRDWRARHPARVPKPAAPAPAGLGEAAPAPPHATNSQAKPTCHAPRTRPDQAKGSKIKLRALRADGPVSVPGKSGVIMEVFAILGPSGLEAGRQPQSR
jgi:hypothetical protein